MARFESIPTIPTIANIATKSDATLELRPLELNDAQAVYKSVDSNREHLQQYNQHTIDAYDSLEKTKDIINNSKPFCWRIGIWVCKAAGVEKSAGNEEFVGIISATFDEVNNEVEIGYWIDADHIGNNYAAIAVAALIRYILSVNNCINIVAKVIGGNTASKEVLRKTGFKPKGTVTEPPKGATNGENVTKYVYEYRPGQLQAGK